MRIVQVDLENVKSYTYAQIGFSFGTNAICGPNGAGKSTLLEAIGFALFDYLGVSQADFVREGEKVANVTVHVEDADGRCYQVVRKCGSYGQYYVYDPEIQQRLTDGKQETVLWLNEFLGTDGAVDLAVLFRDAVGVPQGLLTAAFLETPSRRKETFNPLLRVDEYEQVWEGLREPSRQLDQLTQEQERAIAGFEAQVEGLPGLQERVAVLQSEISSDRADQVKQKEDLAEVVAHLAVLRERQERIEELGKAVAHAETSLQATAARLEDAERAYAASQTAQQVVDGTQASHEAYVAAQVAVTELDAAREEREELRAAQQALSKRLAVANERNAQLCAELAEIEEAKVAMATLAPEVERQTELEAALADARRGVERLATAERDLDREQQRLVGLQHRFAELRSGVEARAEKEIALSELRREWDDLIDSHEQLTARAAAIKAEYAHTQTQREEIDERLMAAERLLGHEETRLNQLTEEHEILQEKSAQLHRLEAEADQLREELAQVEKRQHALTAELATHEAELTQVQRQVELLSASDAPTCPVCGEPLTPQQRVELLARDAQQADALKQLQQEIQAELDDLVAERQREAQALDEIVRRIAAVPRAGEVNALQEQIEAQKEMLATRRASVAAEHDRRDAVAQRLEDLDSELTEVRPQLEGLAALRSERQAAIEALDLTLQALPRPADMTALGQQLEDQMDAVEEAERRQRAHQGMPDEVARLTARLEDLGNPRRLLERAADVVAREERVAADHLKVVAEIAATERGLRDLESDLVAYADLDQRLAVERRTLVDHEPAHRRYLQHIREAEALEDRHATVTELQETQATAQTAYAEVIKAQEDIAQAYDATLHAELNAELSEVRAALARLEERISQRDAQLLEAQDKIVLLRAVQKRLDAARVERRALQRAHRVLDHLRQVLREAGPQMTRVMVELISAHADRLYADIMEAYRSRLQWNEDYEVVLTTAGRDRVFQQLSGGEQMAAALAVRLALLRQTSAIDVAFFDEPTANLDVERRANLARQILNIRGFSQLFVISHDDTFEQDTDHIIRIFKENGVSRVRA